MCVTLTPEYAKFTTIFCGHHQIEARYTAKGCQFTLLDLYKEKQGVDKSISKVYRDPAEMKEAIRAEAEAIIEGATS